MAKNNPNWKDRHHSQFLGDHPVTFDEIWFDDFWERRWYILTIVYKSIFSCTKMAQKQSKWNFATFWQDAHLSPVIGYHPVTFDKIIFDDFWDLTRYIFTSVKKSIFSTRKWLNLSQIEIFQHFKRTVSFPGHRLLSCTFDEIWLLDTWCGTYLQLWKKVYFQTRKWLKISQIEDFQNFKRPSSLASPRLSSCNIWLNLAGWFLRSDVVHTEMYEKNVYFQTQNVLKLDQINILENFEKMDIIPGS